MSIAHSIEVIVQAVDRFSGPLGKISRRMDRFMDPMRRLGRSFTRLGRESGLEKLAERAGKFSSRLSDAAGAAGALVGKLGLIGGGLAVGFSHFFVNTAAKFEDFMATLKTLEGGDIAKAQKSFDWISDFAAKTPYELDEVTEAFVKLRGYGLDPTDGLARSTGDAAAALGKPYMQAVEAIADAVTGENERLKEFGIKASKVGDKIVYEYSQDGKTIRKAVDASNRHLIQKTIEGIWNEKYAGAMDERSKTWNGMLSNLSDWWTRFTNKIMAAGSFEFLKEKLAGILSMLEEMAGNGELERLAMDIGEKLRGALEYAWQAGTRLVAAFQRFMAFVPKVVEFMGGWDNVLIAVAAVIAGPLLMALASLTASFVALGVTIGLTPIGWFIGIVAAIAALAVVVVKAWDPVATFFKDLWKGAEGAFDAFLNYVDERLKSFTGMITGAMDSLLSMVPEGLRSRLGLGGMSTGAAEAQTAPVRTGAGSVLASGAAPAAADQTVRTEVVIRGENLPPGMAVAAPRSQADRTEMDLGYAMSGA